jgi:hypothetical protein
MRDLRAHLLLTKRCVVQCYYDYRSEFKKNLELSRIQETMSLSQTRTLKHSFYKSQQVGKILHEF